MVKVKWLGGNVPKSGGFTFGIPWSKGQLLRDMSLSAKDDSGKKVPLQSWRTAYWPDGSVKWTAHAVSLTDNTAKEITVSKSETETTQDASAVTIKQTDTEIAVNTGKIICVFNKTGKNVIKSISTGEKQICNGGYLECLVEDKKTISGSEVSVVSRYDSDISEAVVESSGPVRCVIRVKGTYLGSENPNDWRKRKMLPFDVRFYFYSGQSAIKVNHTFIFNGNQNTCFIKGIGLKAVVQQSDELYNRHAIFAGDTGLFCESPKNFCSFKSKNEKYTDLYRRQVNGEAVKFDEEEDKEFLWLVNEMATWDDFKMVQLTPDNYTISKRTKPQCTYIKALDGGRSQGLGFMGSVQGGMAACIRNFWQKYPTSIELNGLTKDEGEMALWFWSPDAQSMDLRHYDTETHVFSSYEGFQEMRSTPYGISNMSEFTLWCLDSIPKKSEFLSMAQSVQRPGLPICAPERYKEASVFGEWSLIDRSTPERAFMEDQLDAAFEFYKKEIELRKWYGFWNFGDIMHSYDEVRHSWRYDVGGYAWQNAELLPNVALWYAFLRSGREDIFHMVEAMTRHNSEVDVYHMGEYAGLGSRHNVVHWGCGCKEARVSMAANNRYLYYLTADERLGDLLDEVKDADVSVSRLDPCRAQTEPDPRFDVHLRLGPDIMAFCSNWFTRWERYEDTVYRDKLIKTLDFLKENPYRFRASKTYGYICANTEYIDTNLVQNDDQFLFCFGSQYVWLEIADAMEDRKLESMCMELGQFYSSFGEDREEVLKYANRTSMNPKMGTYSTGLAAYAAYKKNHVGLAEEVWNTLGHLTSKTGNIKFPFVRTQVEAEEYAAPMSEIQYVSTNMMAQWTLNTIMALGLIGDRLPEKFFEKF